MPTEFETQILDINVPAIVTKLRALKAKQEPEVLQKRWVFDIHPAGWKGKGTGEWIRLRQSGPKVTLTHKKRTGTAIDQTSEIEVEVSDFEKTAELLRTLPCFVNKFYQENKRLRFNLDDLEFTLDSWPFIPPFLEIESVSRQRVQQGLKLLQLETADSGHLGLAEIYKKYGLDIHSYPVLKFK